MNPDASHDTRWGVFHPDASFANVLGVSELPSLSQAIGRRMRELRDEHGRTAGEVAEAAQEWGLRWQRSTVASIETGKRGLSAEELVVLPVILSTAFGVLSKENEIHLWDIFGGVEEAAVGDDLIVTTRGLAELVTGKSSTTRGYRRPQQAARVLEWLDPGAKRRARHARIRKLWPDVDGGSLINVDNHQAVQHAASGEAEQKAARKLGVSGVDVAAVSFRLWGHGLTEERDSRAGDNATRRGHVSRALVEDIREVLREVDNG